MRVEVSQCLGIVYFNPVIADPRSFSVFFLICFCYAPICSTVFVSQSTLPYKIPNSVYYDLLVDANLVLTRFIKARHHFCDIRVIIPVTIRCNLIGSLFLSPQRAHFLYPWL
uniref:Uncharacterized protein n=1 Tax=Physcomitrium patens TaxID=3218 RepID=A0A7I4B6K9_PHYPA